MNAILVFVYFNDHPACDESSESKLIEEGVGDCSLSLLLGGMGWLEDEGALGEEEESSRVE